jgi:hypothetical protein
MSSIIARDLYVNLRIQLQIKFIGSTFNWVCSTDPKMFSVDRQDYWNSDKFKTLTGVGSTPDAAVEDFNREISRVNGLIVVNRDKEYEYYNNQLRLINLRDLK